MISEFDARSVLQATHDAWTDGDIDATLANYCDDLTYVCNTGSVNGGPLKISGKAQFRDFLKPVVETLESSSTVRHFSFDYQCGRAFVDCNLRHRSTGLKLVGTYTQLATFGDNKIFRMDEIHDVERMAAFWRLVLSEEEKLSVAIYRTVAGSEENSWRRQLPRAFW